MHPTHRSTRILAMTVLGGAALLPGACGPESGDGGMRGRGGMMRMMGEGGMELPDGVPAGELPEPDSRGAELVETFCGQCHGVPSPRRHSAEDWEATARRMFRRMAHMEGMSGRMGRGSRGGMMMDVEAPTAEEEEAILAYLRRHAMRDAREEDLPDVEGRKAFARICSRCHALPDPGQHEPEAWPDVVKRMRGHMERMEVEEITDAEAERVIRYLRAAAGRGG